jgi:hypothetical protein
MQAQLHQPPATPTALLTPPPGQWRLAAALVLQSRSPGQFRLMTGKAEVSISLLNKSKTFDKPRLGMQIIPAGQRMRIGPRNPLFWVGRDPSALPPDAPTSGLVSLLLERNQGREAAFDAASDDD